MRHLNSKSPSQREGPSGIQQDRFKFNTIKMQFREYDTNSQLQSVSKVTVT